MNQPVSRPSPLALSLTDLRIQAISPKLEDLVRTHPEGHRLAADEIQAALLRLAEEVRTGAKRLAITGWRCTSVRETALVDSFEHQRGAMIRALDEFETQRRSQSPDPKLSNLILVPGPGDAVLARQVAAQLGVSLSPVRVHEFPDGEFKAVAAENVRKKDVYVVMSTAAPVSDNILALEQITSLLNRANAGTITAVVPYFGFARQDRRDKGRREPISARMVADHLEKCGVDKVITVDIHAAQEEGFFNRLDALYGSSVLVPWVKKHIDPAQSVMLAPDSGSVKGADAYAELLGIERRPVIINKRRVGDSEVKMSELVGEVQGLTVIIRDDMISTGGTIAEAAKLAKENGASKVIVVATHAVMAASAYERLMAAPIDKIFVTDSIPSPAIPASDRYQIVPIAPLLAEAIRRDELGESVSGLLTHLFSLNELEVPHLAFDPMTSFR